MVSEQAPDAELMLATGCAHCPAVLAALAELVKQGRIGRLEVTNIARHPEAAEARGVRGVPWIRIGPFELNGAYTQQELAGWATRATSEDGMRDYLLEALAGGQLDNVINACRRSPHLLVPLVRLAGDLDTPYAVRIGIGAVLEELAAEGLPPSLVVDLATLAESPHAQLRADAAHFLGLTGGAEARAVLDRLSGDADADVREIAEESLAAGTSPDP